MHKLNTAERKRTKKDYSEWRALVISIRKPSNPRMCKDCFLLALQDLCEVPEHEDTGGDCS